MPHYQKGSLLNRIFMFLSMYVHQVKLNLQFLFRNFPMTLFGSWKIWWKEKDLEKLLFFSCVWFRENHKEKYGEKLGEKICASSET